MKRTLSSRVRALVIITAFSIPAGVQAADVDAFWVGGTSNWNNASNWQDNVVPNNGADSFSVFIDDGSATASNVTIDIDPYVTNLTIDSDDLLTIGSGHQLRIVAGTINNSGTLALGSTGGNTYLRPRSGPVTLTGGGTVSLSNESNNWIYQESGGSLINVDNTIRGAGHLGYTGVPTSIDNQGTIVADQSTELLVQGGTGALLANSGTYRAENGATLRLNSVDLDNTDGVVEALDNSHVEFDGATIHGGTFQTSGTGAIESGGGGASLIGTAQTINNTGLLRIPNGTSTYAVGTIDNTGTIEIDSTGGNTYLYPNGGPLTLTGGGTLSIGTGGNAWIRSNAGGSLVNIDNTIRGSGNVGYTGTPLDIDNQGTIVADQVDQMDVQGGNGVGVRNTGTIRAENGATLRFYVADVDNTDGVVEALDNSHVTIHSSTIRGGTLQTSGNGVIESANASATLVGTSQTINNTGTVRIPNGTAIYAVGTINNTGTIEIDSTGGNTYLYPIGGPLTLTGGGTLSIGTGGNAWIRQSGNGSLVNVDNTIRGSGHVGYTGTPLNINNQGTILADDASPLIVQGGTGVAFTNTGVARADNNATLSFESAIVDNTNGVIEAKDGSTVTIATTNISGGTLQTDGSGAIQSANASNSLTDLTNAGLFRVPNNTRVYLNGTIHNTGTMSLESGGGNTYIYVNNAPVMLTGGGTVSLSDQGNNWFYQANGGSLVNVDNTIRGSGRLGYTGVPTNITNQALIVADQPTALVIQGGTNATLTNTGTIRAENGGTAALDHASVVNTGGVIEALQGSVVTLASTGIAGGTLQTDGSGYIVDVDASTSLSNVSNTGDLRIQNNSRLYLNGTIANSGTIRLDSVGGNTYMYVNSDPVTLTGGGTVVLTDQDNNWIYQTNGGSLVNADNTIRGAGHIGYSSGQTNITNQGTIIADQPTQLICGGGSGVIFDNQGDMIANGSGGLRLSGAFQTSGTVTINDTSVLNREGTYTQTAGSTVVNGTLNATGDVDIQGGSLGGTGTINDAVTNAGTVSPGNSVGTLTIDDDYTQSSSGELLIEVDNMDNDKLVVTGVAALDGKLTLDFANDPAVGSTYEIMTYASHTGMFHNFDTSCLPDGKSVYVSYSDTAVTLTIGDSLAADVDCDCTLTATDIELFTLALLDPAAYDAATPNCNGLGPVDMNNDGAVNGLDIQPFLEAFIP